MSPLLDSQITYVEVPECLKSAGSLGEKWGNSVVSRMLQSVQLLAHSCNGFNMLKIISSANLMTANVSKQGG